MKNNKLIAIISTILFLFIAVNPYYKLDILAIMALVFILAQKIFGDYSIFLFLIIRPTIDYWREFILFSFKSYNFNLNSVISIAIIAWSTYFFIKNKNYWKDIPHKIPWLLFLIWCSITLFYSFFPSDTVAETLKLTALATIYGIIFILQKKDSKKTREFIIYTIFLSAVIPFAVSIYQFLTHTGIRVDEINNRIFGTFAHPNILATYSLLVFMILFYFVTEEDYFKKIYEHNKIFIISSFAFLALIITLTYTRIAWLGILLFIGLITFIYKRKLFFYIILSISIFYLIFYPINNFLKNEFEINLQSNQIISRLTSRNQDFDSIKWRSDVNRKSMVLILKRPILGYGYGSFAGVWERERGLNNFWDSSSEAHNDYLKVAFETGIIGLILFLSIFASLIYRQIKFGIKNNWKNLVFLCSIFVYLLLSASDNMLHHTPVIWLMWAMWGYWSVDNI